MPLKYANDLAGIRKAQGTLKDDLRVRDFGLEKLAPNGFAGHLAARARRFFLRSIFLPLSRRFRPVVNFYGFTWITRYDDVMAALADHDAFNVPFGLEMAELAGGVTFALGDDGALHERQRRIMNEAWKGISLADDILRPARHAAEALLDDSGGEIDAMKDLFTRVAAEACLKAYGLTTESADEFAEFSMAATALLFADPGGDPEIRRQALIGARRLGEILDADFERAKGGGSGLLASLIRLSGKDEPDPHKVKAEVRALMFGLITGFVPTNTFAAGHILEELASRPCSFERAVELARTAEKLRPAAMAEGAGPAKAEGVGPAKAEEAPPADAHAKAEADANAYADAVKALRDLLVEAARFNPALFPGQFRIRTAAPMKERAAHPALDAIPQGQPVLVATASALMDAAAFADPKRFEPERFDTDHAPRNLMFGYGHHDCLGEELALAIITETFQVLLSRPGVRFARRSQRMGFAGPFPRYMPMVFDPERGHRRQSMVTVAIPIRSPDAAARAEAHLRGLGLPVLPGQDDETKARGKALREALDATGIVHFATIHVVDAGEGGEKRPLLLMDFSVDGPEAFALGRIFDHAGAFLEPLLEHVRPARQFELGWRWSRLRQRYRPDASSLRALALDHTVRFRTRPWGAIGLNFPGTGEFPVSQIEREDELFRAAEEKMHARRLLSEAMPFLDGSSVSNPIKELREELAKDPRQGALLIRPSARRPAFSRWSNFGFYEFIARYFTSRTFLLGYVFFVAATIALPLVLWLFFSHALFPTYVTVWLTPILIGLTALLVLVGILRYRETVVEKPEDEQASHAHMDALMSREDLTGYVQNHLTSVSQLKHGVFRKGTMAFALYIVRQMVLIWFRPGFVTDFGTIHYAKWFRLPGTRKLIFQANYDGSWESYLEDFITKVHGGQTAAWNNGVGFPRTNWFFLDGARDGDRFKRWVRRQQVETAFWYSRFPHLTTENIRTNALVREGLARARTVAEIRAWESLFGSAPRPQTSIESEQVQSILFGSLGRHRRGECIPVRFTDADKARQWIAGMIEASANAENPPSNENVDGALAFGDAEPHFPARFIAFSVTGLEFLGLPGRDRFEGLATFPHSFCQGMARRARILGDDNDVNCPTSWRFSDVEPEARPAGGGGPAGEGTGDAAGAAGGPEVCHAVMLLYALRSDDFARARDRLGEEFEAHDIEALDGIDLRLEGAREDHREPFGFRDGISQPVMRGTRQFAKGLAAPDDVVNPGEFILGYADTRGYFSPTPTISRASDPEDDLPPMHEAVPGQIPEFDHRNLTDLRDFGRNGSFLVVRQLRQDRQAFERYCAAQSSLLATGYLANTLQARVAFFVHEVFGPSKGRGFDPVFGKKWVAAKMMGRWQDGSSLSRHPAMPLTQANRLRFWHAVKGAFVPDQGQRRAFDDPDDDLLGAVRDELVWEDESWNRFLGLVERLKKKFPKVDLPMELILPIVPDNDFRHGTDDPQGLNCPLGSHVRKANPRDSMRPGSALQMEINNRHRLLRRGRTYHVGPASGAEGGSTTQATDEIGTFFMCFNANIERQFEFVQQTWMNARSFHGARHSPDPVVSVKASGDRFLLPTSDQIFTLPLEEKAQGGGGRPADFVSMVGGGYFFLPSRQALTFLGGPRGRHVSSARPQSGIGLTDQPKPVQ